MVKFKFSAFADEYASSLDKQIEGLITNKIRMIEIRGVDGINVSDLTHDQAADVHKKLESAGISVSAIGSPIGKIGILEPFEPHLDKLKKNCETANVLFASKIRMFSFFISDGKYSEYKNEVIDRLGKMLDIADEYGIKLCHENEKGIYGDTPERCAEILSEFKGRLGCVFDPANFVQCGCEPFEYSYNLLKKYITYIHIKDALSGGAIVPAGMGEGGIPELLAVINRAHDGDFILTLEPHLNVFDGLDQLEADGGRSVVKNLYKTSEEAFGVAVEHLRYCIPKTSAIG